MDYPKTRMDNFFAKAAGSELADNDMEPITDREYWINEMAAKINSGGGGGGGATIVECTYDEAAHTNTASITAKEFWDACKSGGVIITFSTATETVYTTILAAAKGGDDNPGYVFAYGDGIFRADSDTDYPVATLE